MARRHRVAIVGAGFGGLFAARALRRANTPPIILGERASDKVRV